MIKINSPKNKYFEKIIIIIIFILYFIIDKYTNNKLPYKKFDIHFKYHNYQREMITEKMKR